MLREDTKVLQEDTVIGPGSVDENGQISKIEVVLEDNTKLVKTCVTQTRQIVQEYINGYILNSLQVNFSKITIRFCLLS